MARKTSLMTTETVSKRHEMQDRHAHKHTESQSVITVQRECRVDKCVTANLYGYGEVTSLMS